MTTHTAKDTQQPTWYTTTTQHRPTAHTICNDYTTTPNKIHDMQQLHNTQQHTQYATTTQHPTTHNDNTHSKGHTQCTTIHTTTQTTQRTRNTQVSPAGQILFISNLDPDQVSVLSSSVSFLLSSSRNKFIQNFYFY